MKGLRSGPGSRKGVVAVETSVGDRSQQTVPGSGNRERAGTGTMRVGCAAGSLGMGVLWA